MVKKNKVAGWIAAILVAVIWGVTGPVSKPLSMAVDSMTLVFFRYVTAVVGLAFIFFLTSKNKNLNTELGSSLSVSKKDLGKLAFCGIVGQGCFSFFNFLSLLHIGATENGMIQGLQPFLTVFFGMMVMHFRMNKIQWAAFIISMVCIYALSTGPTNIIEGGTPWKGYVYVFISVLSLAWTAYLRDSLAKKYGSVVSMLYQYIACSIAGCILVIALGLDLAQIKIILSSPLLIALLIFLGMIISGFSYLIQLYSFKHIGVEYSTMALNLMPLVAYIVAVISFGESMTWTRTFLVLCVVVALYTFSKYGDTNTDNEKEQKLISEQP